MNNRKISYLLNSSLKYFSELKCPSCGATDGRTMDRKYIVTRLVKCNVCSLNYRHPLDSEEFNEEFYNNDYAETDGITTDLPNDGQLASWLKNNFADSAKDMTHHIEVIQAVGKKLDGLHVVDYGANWGYSSYQFMKTGMIVDSYELALDRANFGQKLGLQIKTKESEITSDNDIFYSSHVIEHLPSIPHMMNVAKKSLTNEGYFIAFCPNGSNKFREKHPQNFHKGWGLVHPNYLSDDYFQYMFKENPYYIGSSPYDLPALAKFENEQIIGNLNGDELMVVAKIYKRMDG